MLNLAPKIVSPLLDLRSRSEIYLFAGPCGWARGSSTAAMVSTTSVQNRVKHLGGGGSFYLKFILALSRKHKCQGPLHIGVGGGG